MFVSRKSTEGSFACELGMQVLFSAAARRREESDFSRKSKKVIGKKTRKICMRLILHLFLLMDCAFVLTGYLRFNIQM